MRKLPGVSAMGRLQRGEEDQEMVAPVVVPVSSTRANPLPLEPCTSFQLDLATTPAISAGDMGVSRPTKSMLMTPAPGVLVVTVRVTEVACVSDPLVPVIVRVLEPSGVPAVVLTESLVLPGVPIYSMRTRRLRLRAGR